MATESYSESFDIQMYETWNLRETVGKLPHSHKHKVKDATFSLSESFLCPTTTLGIVNGSLPPLTSGDLETPEEKEQPQACIKLQLQLQSLLHNGGTKELGLGGRQRLLASARNYSWEESGSSEGPDEGHTWYLWVLIVP